MSKLVLIVEDDADQREVLSELLDFEGYRVETAASAVEALAAISKECPGLVITDLNLDGSANGRELLAQIRASCPNPPAVIFTTGMPPDSTKDISGEVLLKPLDLERLRSAVLRFCGPPPTKSG